MQRASKLIRCKVIAVVAIIHTKITQLQNKPRPFVQPALVVNLICLHNRYKIVVLC